MPDVLREATTPRRRRARIDLVELCAELAQERSAGLDALAPPPAGPPAAARGEIARRVHLPLIGADQIPPPPRLPRIAPGTQRDPASPPVAIADIESSEDRFRCTTYRAVLVARACVARQLGAEAAAWAPGSNSAALAARKKGGGFVGCAACPEGRAVANRLLAIAEGSAAR